MKSQQQPSIAPDEARAIAKEAYIYGFPLVDSYRIQYSYFQDKNDPEYKAPWNEIFNNARVYTPKDTAIQSPNSDTPYSYVGADLRAEPLVITVPAIEEKRFYQVQFIDMYTFNFAYVGTRTTGNDAGSFLLAGPKWNGEKPQGIKEVIRSETEFVFVLFRTQLFEASDMKHVKNVQAGYNVQTLSEFLGEPAPAAAPSIVFPRPPNAEQERTSLEFFNILHFILQFCPTHPSETKLRSNFAKLGIGSAPTFNADASPTEIRRALQDGIAGAWKAYEAAEKEKHSGELSNNDILGTREYLKNNYLYRMVAAADGIYGNSKEEAIYPSYYTDAEGKKLDASTGRYQLRFAPLRLPPVNAFWSLTMYEAPSRLLVANRLNRYLINSPMLSALKRDIDGGLTIYIQHESPGKDKEANWLPAPRGTFVAALRLYWPKPEALSGAWEKPPMQRSSV